MIRTLFLHHPNETEYFTELEKQLERASKQREISLWHRKLMLPGQIIKNEYLTQLNQADVIVLFMSVDLLNWREYQQLESDLVDRVREGKAKLIMVLVGSCLYEHIEWLETLKPLVLPADNLFLSSMSAEEQTGWITQIAQYLLHLANSSKYPQPNLEVTKPVAPAPVVQNITVHGPVGNIIGSDAVVNNQHVGPAPEPNVPPATTPSKPANWHEHYWAKSAGKAMLLAIPTGIFARFIPTVMDHWGEASAVAFCLSMLFFISQDPKYKYYRTAVWLFGAASLINVLPMLDIAFQITEPNPDMPWHLVFKLGIQDNAIPSILLMVVGLATMLIQYFSEQKN